MPLLTGEKSGGELAALLERYHLANRDAGRELRLGLLCDLPDRDRPMGEREQAWVETASAAVEQLNKAYGGGFYLFFGCRSFMRRINAIWGGTETWGAGGAGAPSAGKEDRFADGGRGLHLAARGVRYVVTLDADTASA